MLFPTDRGVDRHGGFAVLAREDYPDGIWRSPWLLDVRIGLTAIMVPVICSLIPLKIVSERWAKENAQWIGRRGRLRG
jgi:hypothetical protein